MLPENIINKITDRISTSVDRVLSATQEGRIETEPSFTDRLLANIERDCEGHQFPYLNESLSLKARTLKDRGPKAAESVYGADVATVLNINLHNYNVNKGILAQSKFVSSATVKCSSTFNSFFVNDSYYLRNPLKLNNASIAYEKTGTIEFPFPKSEFDRLNRQCELMLKITPDSFVYLYHTDDIYVVPAVAVNGSPYLGPTVKYYCKNFKSFVSEYFRSFIGDRKLNGIKDGDFERLLTETNARQLLYFQISYI